MHVFVHPFFPTLTAAVMRRFETTEKWHLPKLDLGTFFFFSFVIKKETNPVKL